MASAMPDPTALDQVLPLIRCPLCGESLTRNANALVCPSRHTFDIARQGYVSLLGGDVSRSGDDAKMVDARQKFLATDQYVPIREAITRLADPSAAVILDIGCGPGNYLASTLDALPGAAGLGLDSSSRALRIAARCHARAAAAAWDVFRPFPIVSESVDLILDVFSPRNPAEFHRILRPHGRLIVARPTAGHLSQLRDQIAGMVEVDPIKEDRLHQVLDPYFTPIDTIAVDYRMSLTPEETADLLGMTPSAHHVAAKILEAPAAELFTEADVSVLVTAYRRRLDQSD
jgi:23S rRNA (guanine745-N1)-methyltransferase